MSNCDDLFRQIQALEAQKKGLNDALAPLMEVDADEPDPARVFAFRDRAGKRVEVDFDEVWKQLGRDPLATQDMADAAIANRETPMGSEGRFENLGLLVDRIGLDDARGMAAFLFKMTGDWAELNPRDFNLITSINDKQRFLDHVQAAFTEARIQIDRDKLSQAIAANVAPFLGILNRQTKLRTFALVTRNNLREAIKTMSEQIAATGVRPTREAKSQFLDAYAKALFAHRSERVASRKSGQLLQNYQRMLEEGDAGQGAFWGEVGSEGMAEVEAVADELITMTPADMVKEGSIPRAVVEAADKGPAGLKDLQGVLDIINTEGVDPGSPLDKDWEKLWKRSARAGYKDSILFNPRSQLLMNYASQKIVFAVEGFKKVAGENAWTLYGNRGRGAQLSLLGDDPVALDAARGQPVYVNPLATGFFRDAMKAQLDGARIAVEAGLRAEAIIKQSWSESLRKGFLLTKAETPFAGNVDAFMEKGQLTIPEQYRAAQEVLDEPWDPKRFHFQLRDKIHIGLKVLANSKIEQLTGKKLPVYSALQMMTAVDHRAGLRNFMTDRANELIMEQASLYPDRTLKEWADAADQQLQDQLYQATPSQQNIKDARTQFMLDPDEVSDDEVAAFLAAEKVGMPVLVTPGQSASKSQSIAMRMQDRQTKGVAGAIDQFASNARQSEWVDAQLPFWRSPYNQLIWDVSLANPFTPVSKVVQVAMNLPAGKVTPKMLAEAQASTITWLSLAGMALGLRQQGLIIGNGPIDPQARKQWLQRLNAEGKVPNSIAGVPFNMGGVPVLNSMFLLVDAMDLVDQGNVSEYDRINAWTGMVQLGAGVVMRMPGFRQVQMIYDAFAGGNENAFRKLAGWFLNGQANPASGVERSMEWGAGTTTNDLQRPRAFNSGDERWDLNQLPVDHPLRSSWYQMQKWIYESNPGIAHWTGVPIKETTWLGRELRRPEGIFRSEWPVGVPGVWEFNKGDYKVETRLELMGLLNPPGPLMKGHLDGVPMTPDLEKEFNSYLGTVKPQTSFSRNPRSPGGGRVVWFGEQAEQKSPDGRSGRTMREQVDMTRLMDQAVQGRTVREAIRFVLDSPQWRKLDANPEYTTNPRVNDRPKAVIQRQPGPFLIKRIKEFYSVLALEEVEQSSTPAAQQWRSDRMMLDRDPAEVPAAQRWLQQAIR